MPPYMESAPAAMVPRAAMVSKPLRGYRAGDDAPRGSAISRLLLVGRYLNDISTRFFAYELIRDLRNARNYQFEAKVEEHRELLHLVLKGADHEIEVGFREVFARFLNHVLARFQEEATRVIRADPSALTAKR